MNGRLNEKRFLHHLKESLREAANERKRCAKMEEKLLTCLEKNVVLNQSSPQFHYDAPYEAKEEPKVTEVQSFDLQEEIMKLQAELNISHSANRSLLNQCSALRAQLYSTSTRNETISEQSQYYLLPEGDKLCSGYLTTELREKVLEVLHEWPDFAKITELSTWDELVDIIKSLVERRKVPPKIHTYIPSSECSSFSGDVTIPASLQCLFDMTKYREIAPAGVELMVSPRVLEATDCIKAETSEFKVDHAMNTSRHYVAAERIEIFEKRINDLLNENYSLQMIISREEWTREKYRACKQSILQPSGKIELQDEVTALRNELCRITQEVDKLEKDKVFQETELDKVRRQMRTATNQIILAVRNNSHEQPGPSKRYTYTLVSSDNETLVGHDGSGDDCGSLYCRDPLWTAKRTATKDTDTCAGNTQESVEIFKSVMSFSGILCSPKRSSYGQSTSFKGNSSGCFGLQQELTKLFIALDVMIKERELYTKNSSSLKDEVLHLKEQLMEKDNQMVMKEDCEDYICRGRIIHGNRLKELTEYQQVLADNIREKVHLSQQLEERMKQLDHAADLFATRERQITLITSHNIRISNAMKMQKQMCETVIRESCERMKKFEKEKRYQEETCLVLKEKLDDALNRADTLRITCLESDELLGMLFKVYFMFRRMESKRAQLVFQKAYLTPLIMTTIPPVCHKKTLKSAALAIAAIHR